MDFEGTTVRRRSMIASIVLAGTGIYAGTGVGTAQSNQSNRRTENHEYRLPQGDGELEQLLSANFEQLDTDIEIRDGDNRTGAYEPAPGRQFVATDTGAVYTGTDGGWVLADRRFDELAANTVNGTACVGTESELAAALGDVSHIKLVEDITTESHLQGEYSTDVTIDMNGHRLRRADRTPETILELKTSGIVRVKNGVIDGNRAGQEFPNQKGHKELTVKNARSVVVEDVTVVDNQGFGIGMFDADDVVIRGCRIDTAPGGLGEDAAGLDGIHLYNPRTVSIEACTIRAGDDAVAITAVNRDVNNITISGNFSSPEHANGVRLNLHESSTDVSLGSVTIDATIDNVAGSGVVFNAEQGTSPHVGDLDDTAGGGRSPTRRVPEAIENVNVSGAIRSAGGSGISAKIPVRNASFDCAMTDCGRDGIELAAGGSNIDIAGSIIAPTRYGIFATGVSGLSVDSVIDGEGELARGIRMNGCKDVSLSPVVRRTGGVDHANGIEAERTQHVTVTGASISETAAPLVTYKGCDYWTVVGNHGHDNDRGSPSMVGENNVVSQNNFN